MKEIENYDIITLINGMDYTVLQAIMHEGKKYYLLAPVDDEEEPNLEKLKIVEEVKIENKVTITEKIDEKLREDLAKLFLVSMNDVLNEL